MTCVPVSVYRETARESAVLFANCFQYSSKITDVPFKYEDLQGHTAVKSYYVQPVSPKAPTFQGHICSLLLKHCLAPETVTDF